MEVDRLESGLGDFYINTNGREDIKISSRDTPSKQKRESIISSHSNKHNHLEGIKELLAYKRRRFHSMDSFESNCSTNGKSKRLVTKDGFVDIKYTNIPGHNFRYLVDIFHTLMDLKWRYIMIMFSLSFLISWIGFGTIWYVIVYIRKGQNCVDNVDSWVSAFLFSVETQSTIGYGGRAVTGECIEGVLLLVVQTIVGMFINSAMLGLLFAKIARPKSRGKTLMFSKKAVITVRDNNLCLMFRYVDLRHQKLLDTNLRAVIVRPKLTQEGEFIPIDMADLNLTVDFQQVEYTMRLFPLYPLTIIHVINEDSPLYSMSKQQLEQAEFEIIPILEGTVPTTGNSTQALTSYRPSDILWGHRFKPVFTGIHIGLSINKIDLSTLHDTYKESHTPDCSAEIYEKLHCKDEEDYSASVSESNGYESGPNSRSSLNFNYHKNVDDISNDVCININTESIQRLSSLKESSA